MTPRCGINGRALSLPGFPAVFARHIFRVPPLWAGNDLFFVLSRYLITGILVSQPRERFSQRFYWRRFLRIFPLHYVVLGLVFATLHREQWSKDRARYVLYASNFRDALIGNTPHYHAPLWSLAVEEQFYLIWPVVNYPPASCVPALMDFPAVGWRICRARKGYSSSSGRRRSSVPLGAALMHSTWATAKAILPAVAAATAATGRAPRRC